MVNEGGDGECPIDDDSDVPCQKSVAPVLQPIEVSSKNVFVGLLVGVLITSEFQRLSDAAFPVETNGLQVMASALFRCVSSASNDLK